MKYYTKEWFDIQKGSNVYELLKISKEAELFSEKYFQELYHNRLKEFLELHKRISEVTADELFPENAWETLFIVNENGNFIDATTRLTEEEYKKIRDNIRRKEKEARDKFIPVVYDEEKLKNTFQDNLNGKIEFLKSTFSEDILNDVADIRVLAFDQASENVYKKICKFCVNKEEQLCDLYDQYQQHYKSIDPYIPEHIKKNYGFHDCRVNRIEQQGPDVVMDLDHSGEYSNVHKVIYRNAVIIEEEDIAGSCWVYDEIYITDGRYEFHAALQDGEGQVRYLTIRATEVDFEMDEMS